MPAPEILSAKLKTEIDDWMSRHRLATKHDIEAMERRLTKLIKHQDVIFNYSIAVSKKERKKNMPLQLKINDEQKVNVTLNPVTSSGKPVKVDGKPEWVADAGGSTLQVSQDGMSATLISSDLPSVTVFTVSADADLGQGVTTISDTIELTVTDPQASSLGLKADPPVDK